MLARQPLSTFTAESATAAGVATSSQAEDKTRQGQNAHQERGWGGGWNSREKRLFRGNKGFLRSVLLATVPLKEREIDFLDSSSAGVCSRGALLAS